MAWVGEQVNLGCTCFSEENLRAHESGVVASTGLPHFMMPQYMIFCLYDFSVLLLITHLLITLTHTMIAQLAAKSSTTQLALVCTASAIMPSVTNSYIRSLSLSCAPICFTVEGIVLFKLL